MQRMTTEELTAGGYERVPLDVFMAEMAPHREEIIKDATAQLVEWGIEISSIAVQERVEDFLAGRVAVPFWRKRESP